MKVIVTKYALTSGVRVVTAKETHSVGMINVNGECFHKPDWHTTTAEAAYQIGKMTAAKRRSLTKALTALDEKVLAAMKIVTESKPYP